MSVKTKQDARNRRKLSIRKKISGSTSLPRVSVYRSNQHIYAQVIDDTSGNTLVAASTLSPELKEELKGLKKSEQAQRVGKLLASKCLQSNIEKIVFDRNGFIYHGRVQELANAARDAGLKF